MANPHFQNLILWAGNTVASKSKKDLPMFQPYPSDQTYYGYFNDFMNYVASDWTITSTDGGGDSGEVIQITSGAGGQLIVTTNDADNDSEELQLKGESFLIDGNKRVILARLNDVQFFWDTDIKNGSFINWNKQLESIIFQNGCGSIAEKVDRMSHLCHTIGDQIDIKKNTKTFMSKFKFRYYGA